jgi:hypothetical protein
MIATRCRHHHRLLLLLFLLLLTLAFTSPTFPPPPYTPSPQYILVNKALGSPDPLAWSPTNPDSITQESFDAIINTVGTRGSYSRRLGVSVQLPVFFQPQSGVTAFLQKLLVMCEANDMPVAFALDPFEFWEGTRRPFPKNGTALQ